MVRFPPKHPPSRSEQNKKKENAPLFPIVGDHHRRTPSATTRELLRQQQQQHLHQRFQPLHLRALQTDSSSSLLGMEGDRATPSSVKATTRSALIGSPVSTKQFVIRELTVISFYSVYALILFLVFHIISPLHLIGQQWTLHPSLTVEMHRESSVFPLWQGRLTEYALGRISRKHIATSLSIHMAVVIMSRYAIPLISKLIPWLLWAKFRDLIVQESSTAHAEKDSSRFYWLELSWNILSETIGTAIVVVSLLVLPTIFELNGVSPTWGLLVLSIPISCFDSPRRFAAPILLPHFIVAVEPLFAVGRRVMTGVLGSLLAGEIMDLFFPDG